MGGVVFTIGLAPPERAEFFFEEWAAEVRKARERESKLPGRVDWRLDGSTVLPPQIAGQPGIMFRARICGKQGGQRRVMRNASLSPASPSRELLSLTHTHTTLVRNLSRHLNTHTHSQTHTHIV